MGAVYQPHGTPRFRISPFAELYPSLTEILEPIRTSSMRRCLHDSNERTQGQGSPWLWQPTRLILLSSSTCDPVKALADTKNAIPSLPQSPPVVRRCCCRTRQTRSAEVDSTFQTDKALTELLEDSLFPFLSPMTGHLMNKTGLFRAGTAIPTGLVRAPSRQHSMLEPDLCPSGPGCPYLSALCAQKPHSIGYQIREVQ